MLDKNDKKNLVFFSLICFLFVYPLIQSGIFYRDDLDRAITGQYGWKSLGRPVADLMMRILSASGKKNLDLYPYTIILSILFIAISALFLYKYLEKKEIKHSFFVASLLIFNPYILQNFLYRFDSSGMALAFLLSVIAYTYDNKKSLFTLSIRVISGIIALSIYQPCVNIFIGFAAIDLAIFTIRKENKLNQVIKHLSTKAGEFILFYILYILLVAKIWKNPSSRSAIVSINSDGFDRVMHTIKEPYNLIVAFMHDPVYIYFLIPIIGILTLSLIKTFKAKKLRLISIVYTLLSIFIFYISLLGPTLILQESPVYARTLVSFSVIFIIMAILLIGINEKFKYLVIIPVITVFAFSAQLSNALKEQRNHEDFVFNMISRDLLKIGELNEIRTIGTININERTKIILNQKPAINYFLSPAEEFIASFQLVNKGFTNTNHGYWEEHKNKIIFNNFLSENISPLIQNREYSIYVKDKTAIIRLGNNL
ncbi:glucosyltransferase domain-containing protein [Budvicia aquatica]|uniref:glucosyltransferase domain-containing protein n=1 Tax=Budvicia aquatica TaxID=82979 RepID=UPI00207E7FBC|nr:glucosyltransferase domain-containing protein [Budvicia aquatica]GKX50978.1 hypothetical protein SOASR029_12870 [Budvicia aquatica]